MSLGEGDCLLALLGLSFEFASSHHQFLLFIHLSLLLFDCLLFGLKFGFGGRCVVAGASAGGVGTRRGERIGKVRDCSLATKLSASPSFEVRLITLSFSRADGTLTSPVVGMTTMAVERGLVQTCFLGCK
jgi:hypothetical protein